MTLEYFTGYNCFILFIPILLWNGLLMHKLPLELQKEPSAMPKYILRTETLLRVAVFGLPFFIPLNSSSSQFNSGIIIYLSGIMVYFASWLPLMIKPESPFTRCIIIWTGPAWTPLFFLTGIAVIGWSVIYGIFSFMFIASHLYHEVIRYKLINCKNI